MLPRGNQRQILPLLIATLGIIATVVFWDAQHRERRQREQSSLASVAGDSRRAIEAETERQIEAMRDLAISMAHIAKRSQDAWRAEAARALEIFPGLVRLAWIGADGEIVRIATQQDDPGWGGEASVQGWAAAVPLHQRGPRMLGPLGDADSGYRYDLVVPAEGSPGERGILVAGVEIQQMLGAILGDSAPGYAIRVDWAGREVFRRGDADRSHPWWRNDGAVALSPGVRWQTRYFPTHERVVAALAPWPRFFLLGGIVISILLGALIHQLRSAEGTVKDLDGLNQELERRVEERTHELRDAVTELESFNYSVSHDLRSPLGAILTFAAVLEEDFGGQLDAEALAMLARIRGAAQNSMELLEGLLELSRASSTELHCEVVDVASLAREVWAEAASGSERDVHLELGPLPEAWADSRLLRQVLIHLLRNALRFSASAEKPSIVLGGELTDSERIYSVRDNGVGFDMRFADKLFLPFESVHTESELRGTGVGLAVVHRIIARHGGRVWAEGVTEAGATFYFALPLGPAGVEA